MVAWPPQTSSTAGAGCSCCSMFIAHCMNRLESSMLVQVLVGVRVTCCSNQSAITYVRWKRRATNSFKCKLEMQTYLPRIGSLQTICCKLKKYAFLVFKEAWEWPLLL